MLAWNIQYAKKDDQNKFQEDFIQLCEQKKGLNDELLIDKI